MAIAVASRLPAQSVRVELQDSTTGAPVVGALVAAIDSAGGVAVERLTDVNGVVILRLPGAGRWMVQVRRIGFPPRRVPDLLVEGTQQRVLALTMSSARQTLAAVRVVSGMACGRAPTGNDRAAQLWEQFVIALRSSEVSRTDSLDANSTLTIRTVKRERRLSPELALEGERLLRTTLDRGRSFGALDADSLAAIGYIVKELDGGSVYYAPDESVLLSESFAATHCFDLPKKDASPALAELRFTPVRSRRLPDIRGTLFIDAASGEPRRLEYSYVASAAFLPSTARHAGGHVELARLDDGRWIVSSWALRMPRYGLVGRTHFLRLIGYLEVSGTATVQRPDGGPPPPDR